MGYVTPRTDWAEGDGVRDVDMNRIEGNIEAVQDIVFTMTVQPENWSNTAPYTQVIENEAFLDKAHTVIRALYLTDGWSVASTEAVIARRAAALSLDRVTFTNGTMTLRCYRQKPTAPFVLLVKGA